MNMALTKITAENFTVFENITIPFTNGLNVLVGENGMGKTHIMKLAYAACQASRHDVSFSKDDDAVSTRSVRHWTTGKPKQKWK